MFPTVDSSLCAGMHTVIVGRGTWFVMNPVFRNLRYGLIKNFSRFGHKLKPFKWKTCEYRGTRPMTFGGGTIDLFL